MEDERIISGEIHLGVNHWNNLDAKYKNWSEYNKNAVHIRRREELVKKLINLIKVEMAPLLTTRQRQITKLYFDKELNEDQIARILGISQPTVSQHLFGKKRNGKKIGGSIRKIRKIILKNSCSQDVIGQSEYLIALKKFLDGTMRPMRKKYILKPLRVLKKLFF